MTDSVLTEQAARQIFTEARTHSVWRAESVDDEVLKQAYDLMKFGPTSANCSPLRIIFVKTTAAKERLKPALSEGNIEKTMAAPVTAIFAQDMKFYEHLPMLFPHADARAWFAGNEALITATAMRNSTLQAAYFMIAARACGLDCGPMSGFDAEKLNREFFKESSFQANFLCNLGYGDKTRLFPRSPRFDFVDVCRIA